MPEHSKTKVVHRFAVAMQKGLEGLGIAGLEPRHQSRVFSCGHRLVFGVIAGLRWSDVPDGQGP